MRINQITHSKGFVSFVNTMSFIFSVCCFILVILLPLPYHREPPGTISLCTDPDKAPFVIVICVFIPFLSGVIFQLIYKMTYKKSKQELLNELTENVANGFITNETKWNWEFDVENHQLWLQERYADLIERRKQKYMELKRKEKSLIEKVQDISETKESDLSAMN